MTVNPAAPSEKAIVQRIIRWLNDQPDTFAHKTHGGPYGSAGEPDIDACMAGRTVKLEVKRPGGPGATALQARRLRQWEAAGAVVGVVRSVQDTKDVLADHGILPSD